MAHFHKMQPSAFTSAQVSHLRRHQRRSIWFKLFKVAGRRRAATAGRDELARPTRQQSPRAPAPWPHEGPAGAELALCRAALVLESPPASEVTVPVSAGSPAWRRRLVQGPKNRPGSACGPGSQLYATRWAHNSVRCEDHALVPAGANREAAAPATTPSTWSSPANSARTWPSRPPPPSSFKAEILRSLFSLTNYSL